MNTINPVSLPTTLPGNPLGQAEAPQDASSFRNFLVDSIQKVNTMQQDADRAVEQLVSGGNANPAEVLTAVQKADIAFRMMMQIRNKMVQAYQEVQNIRI